MITTGSVNTSGTFMELYCPDIRETVGIGDACKTWFYGPESQLVFLDTFILKKGYANWLAFKIKENREVHGALKSSGSQQWTTIHTELYMV